jgi:hypothetical protein
MKIRPVGAEFFHAYGRTDRNGEGFRNFANTYKSLLRAKHNSLDVKGIYSGEGKQNPVAPSCLTYAKRLRVRNLSVFLRLIRSMVRTTLGEDRFKSDHQQNRNTDVRTTLGLLL